VDPDQPHGCGEVKTFATPAVPDLRLTVDPPTSHLPAGLRFTVTNPGPGTTGPAELQIVVHESYPGSFTEVTLFGHRCELRSPRLAVCQLGSIPPGQHEDIFEYSHVFPPGGDERDGRHRPAAARQRRARHAEQQGRVADRADGLTARRGVRTAG
jgi:hypothetical protein